MSGPSQVALFYQLAYMIILCCFLKRKAEEVFTYVSTIVPLNANMVTDVCPLPYIGDLLSQLKGARVFSSLDLPDSYH